MDYDPEEEPVNREKGIDWDLHYCLENNPQPGFKLKDVEKVLAVIEGEHDGPAWHWILELTNGKFAYLIGWCDYTGWDCQSGAESVLEDSAEEACLAARYYQDGDISTPVQREQNKRAGVLQTQVEAGKKKTRHEIVDEKMQAGED
jgi:hypothetical protein